MASNIDYAKYESVYRGDCAKVDYLSSDGEIKSRSSKELNIAKMVCEDWVSLIYGDTDIVEIKKANENATEKEEKLESYFKNNVRNRLHTFTEQVFALGQGIVVPYKEDDQVKLDFLVGSMFEVKKWSNGRPKVIEYEWKLGDEELKTTIVNEGGKAEVTHESKKPGVEKPEDYTLDYEIPYWKPNLANNKRDFNIGDAGQEYGISVFANCIDSIEQYSKNFYYLTSDITKSQKKVGVHKDFADKRTFYKDKDGVTKKNRMTFDHDGETFLLLDGEDFKGMLQMIDGKPISSDIIQVANFIIKDIGNSVGLKDYYEVDKGVVKTATEAMSEKSALYSRKMLHQLLLRTNIGLLMKNISKLLDTEGVEYDVVFNDSIITDDNKMREDDRLDVVQGLLPKHVYMERWQGYSSEEAKQFVEEQEANQQTFAPVNLA